MCAGGCWCFRVKGEYVQILECYDSEYDHLGANIVEEIQQDGKLELVGKWRRLFELGIITWMDDTNGELNSPPQTEEQTDHRKEWDAIVQSLPQEEKHVVSRWFRGMYNCYCHGDQDVRFKRSFFKEANTPLLKFGNNIFIDYIYLIDLDNNEFSALHVPHGTSGNLIYRWPFADIPDNWKNIASTNTPMPGFTCAAFPLPDVVEMPMRLDLQSNGYKCDPSDQWEFFGLRSGLKIFKDQRTGKNCAIHFFFPVDDNEKKTGGPRAVVVADVLMDNPHPRIVPTLSNTRLGHCPAVVYEHCEKNLSQLNSNDPTIWLNIYGQIAEGLIHLHKLGIIHDRIEPKWIKYRETKVGITTHIDAMISFFDGVCVPFLDHANKNSYWNRDAKPIKSRLFRSLSWGPYEDANLRCFLRDEEDDGIPDAEEVSGLDVHDEPMLAEDEANIGRDSDTCSRRFRLLLKRLDDPKWEKGWEPSANRKFDNPWLTDLDALVDLMTKNKTLFPDDQKPNSIAWGAIAGLVGNAETKSREKDMTDFEVGIDRLERFVEYLNMTSVRVDLRDHDKVSTGKRKDPPSQLHKNEKLVAFDRDNKVAIEEA